MIKLRYEEPIFLKSLFTIAGVVFAIYVSKLVLLLPAIFLIFHKYLRYCLLGILILVLHNLYLNYRYDFLTIPLYNETLIGEVEHIDKVKNRILLSNVSLNYFQFGKVIFYFKSLDEDLSNGDLVSFKANLYPISGKSLDGRFDYTRYCKAKRINARGKVIGHGHVSILNTNNWSIRSNIRKFLLHIMKEEEAMVFGKMVIGNEMDITSDLQSIISTAGLAHILAISGMHMGIFMGIIIFVLRLLLGKSHNKLILLFAVLSGFCYLSLAGWTVSATRAFLMSSMCYVSLILNKKTSLLKLWSIACFVILVYSPYSVLEAGTQMSFIATLFLILSAGIYKKLKLLIENKLLYYFLSILFSTLLVNIVLSPILLYHFKVISFSAILANLVVVPLANFIVIPSVIIFIVSYFMGFGEWMTYIISTPVSFIISIAKNIPNFSYQFINFNSFSLLLSSIGLISLFIVKYRMKYIGLIFLFLSILNSILIDDTNNMEDEYVHIKRNKDNNYSICFFNKYQKNRRSHYYEKLLREKYNANCISYNESGLSH